MKEGLTPRPNNLEREMCTLNRALFWQLHP